MFLRLVIIWLILSIPWVSLPLGLLAPTAHAQSPPSQAQADLVAEDIWWTPLEINAGDQVVFGFRVRNAGTASSSGPFKILFTKNSGVATLCVSDIPDLAAQNTLVSDALSGQGTTLLDGVAVPYCDSSFFRIEAPANGGGITFLLQVDRNNQVQESNELNNILFESVAVTIPPPPPPPLSPTAAPSPTPTPAPFEGGETPTSPAPTPTTEAPTAPTTEAPSTAPTTEGQTGQTAVSSPAESSQPGSQTSPGSPGAQAPSPTAQSQTSTFGQAVANSIAGAINNSPFGLAASLMGNNNLAQSLGINNTNPTNMTMAVIGLGLAIATMAIGNTALSLAVALGQGLIGLIGFVVSLFSGRGGGDEGGSPTGESPSAETPDAETEVGEGTAPSGPSSGVGDTGSATGESPSAESPGSGAEAEVGEGTEAEGGDY